MGLVWGWKCSKPYVADMPMCDTLKGVAQCGLVLYGIMLLVENRSSSVESRLSLNSDGVMIRLETLIELKFLNSSFSSPSSY